MQITLKYRERSYGNSLWTANFSFTVKDPKLDQSYLRLFFELAPKTRGRGQDDWSQGEVESLSIDIDRQYARSIATAILWHLENEDTEAIKLNFQSD